MIEPIKLCEDPVIESKMKQVMKQPELPFIYNYRKLTCVFCNLKALFCFIRDNEQNNRTFESYIQEFIDRSMPLANGFCSYATSANAITFYKTSVFDDHFAYYFPFRNMCLNNQYKTNP